MNSADWCDLEKVVDFARQLGPGQTITKHEGRANYNITHTARTDLWQNVPGVKVVLHV